MQLGFVSSIFGDVPLAEVIHFAGEEGFDCVELMCWPREGSFAGVCHVDAAALSDSAAEQVNQMCADAAVEVSALGYYPNVLSSNAIEAASARDHLCKVIDAAVLLGFSTVNTFIGGDHRKPADENLRTFAEVWPELIRYAEDRGVLIGIENCPMLLGEESWPSGTNVARSPEVWRLMFATIPSENFGLNLDPSHLVWQFIDPVEPIHQFSDRLFHVHAKDTHVDRRRLNEIGVLGMGWHTPKLPGKGDIDWRQWIAALKTVGYEGAICIEVEDEDYYGSLETRKEALRVAGDLLRPLIDEEA